MDPEALSRALHRRYPEDIAQEALLALFKRGTPHPEPLAYCRAVARGLLVNGYRRGESRWVHVSPGPDYEFRVDLTFGHLDPVQQQRVEALEVLEGLSRREIRRGLGDFDPPPLDPKPRSGGYEKSLWRKRIKRLRARRRLKAASGRP